MGCGRELEQPRDCKKRRQEEKRKKLYNRVIEDGERGRFSCTGNDMHLKQKARIGGQDAKVIGRAPRVPDVDAVAGVRETRRNERRSVIR